MRQKLTSCYSEGIDKDFYVAPVFITWDNNMKMLDLNENRWLLIVFKLIFSL